MKEDGERIKLSEQELRELSRNATAEERLLWGILGGPTKGELEEVKSRTPEERAKLMSVVWDEEDDHVLSDMLDEKLANHLTPREAQVLKGRFGLEDGTVKTLKQLGRDIQRSETTVRRIERTAISKLKNPKLQ